MMKRVFAILVLSAVSAQAGLIEEGYGQISGTITGVGLYDSSSGSIDTGGIFAPAGSNLIAESVSLEFLYFLGELPDMVGPGLTWDGTEWSDAPDAEQGVVIFITVGTQQELNYQGVTAFLYPISNTVIGLDQYGNQVEPELTLNNSSECTSQWSQLAGEGDALCEENVSLAFDRTSGTITIDPLLLDYYGGNGFDPIIQFPQPETLAFTVNSESSTIPVLSPEPSTWLAMALGLGFFVVRRRWPLTRSHKWLTTIQALATKRLLAVLAISALSAIGAQADSFSATVTGTITSGIDYDGIFGANGGGLVGDTITIGFYWVVGPNIVNLEYSGSDSWYTGPFGALNETVTVNSKAYHDDGDGGESSELSGPDQNGVPTSPSLSDLIYGLCTGKFAVPNAPECFDEVITDLNLAAETGTILSEAGADALFASVTGGTLTINPYEIGCIGPCTSPPYGLYTGGPDSYETLTFTTSPEPTTFLAMVLGLCGVGVARRCRGFQRRRISRGGWYGEH